MKIINKELIENKIESLKYDYVLGAYDRNIDNISKKELKKVLDSIDGSHSDIFVSIKKKLYIVEIAPCDDDIDLMLYDAVSYFRKYGEMVLDEALDNEKITEEQYNDILSKM